VEYCFNLFNDLHDETKYRRVEAYKIHCRDIVHDFFTKKNWSEILTLDFNYQMAQCWMYFFFSLRCKISIFQKEM
jgi:hypothetical protein